MERSVFTKSDVAKICRVARRTVDKWIGLGLLDFYRLPGSRDWRVNRGDLVRFLEKSNIPLRWLEEFELASKKKEEIKVARKEAQAKTNEVALQPIVLHTREVAKVLGISQDTVCKWARAGIIPHVRVDGRKTILYPLNELKAWLSRQSRGGIDGKKSK
jgi:excisionase family DNA binding protein